MLFLISHTFSSTQDKLNNSDSNSLTQLVHLPVAGEILWVNHMSHSTVPRLEVSPALVPRLQLRLLLPMDGFWILRLPI